MEVYQLKHEHHPDRPILKLPVALVLDNLSDNLNVGSIFRLADALGVEKMWLCGETPSPPHKVINRTSRGAHHHVDFEHVETTVQCLDRLRADGYTIALLEIMNTSKDLRTIDFRALGKVALVVGREFTGITEEVLGCGDLAVHIPMLGRVHSLNVATSAAIALYELVRQFEVFR
jgi:23S rRNA (guanosine2251-2'-O)-methyltransferase